MNNIIFNAKERTFFEDNINNHFYETLKRYADKNIGGTIKSIPTLTQDINNKITHLAITDTIPATLFILTSSFEKNRGTQTIITAVSCHMTFNGFSPLKMESLYVPDMLSVSHGFSIGFESQVTYTNHDFITFTVTHLIPELLPIRFYVFSFAFLNAYMSVTQAHFHASVRHLI